MKVEIWSDVVCPWCFVGKRRFETALAGFEHRDDVEVVWRSFELDPQAPAQRPGPYASHLAHKYRMTDDQAEASVRRMVGVGRDVGIHMDFDHAQPGNTFDAHRLIHLAGQQGKQDDMKERLLRAYFSEGVAISDRRELARLAGDVGLDRAEVEEMLAGERFRDEVRADEERAHALGISAVPFFVFEEQYGVSGAQAPEVLGQALTEVWAHTHRQPALRGAATGSDGDAYGDDGCSIA